MKFNFIWKKNKQNQLSAENKLVGIWAQRWFTSTMQFFSEQLKFKDFVAWIHFFFL